MLSSWVVLGHQHQMGTRVWLLCSSAQYSLSTPQGWGNLKAVLLIFTAQKNLWELESDFPFLPVVPKLFSCFCDVYLGLCTNILFYHFEFAMRCSSLPPHSQPHVTAKPTSLLLYSSSSLGPLVWLIWTSWPQIMVKASSFKHKNDRKKGCFHLHSLLTLRFCSFCSLFCKRQSIL